MKSSLFSSYPSSPSLSSHHHSYSASPSSTLPYSHHAFSDIMAEENIDWAELVIKKWEIDAGKLERFSTIFVGDRKEAKRLLEAVMGLQHAMQYYVKLTASSDKLIRAQKLMEVAMKRLEIEFYMILSANRKNLDSESVSSRSSIRSSISDFYEDEVSDFEENTMMTPPRTPPRPSGGSAMSEGERASDMTMADLKGIAECMIACGYGKECVNIYRIIRKSIVDETVYHLGVERLNVNQMKKMEWGILETKIKRWQHAVKIAVKTLFYGERILCYSVFSSSEKIAESCFIEISRHEAMNLFTFPENVAKCKKILSPEKIFRLLDLYESISDLWSEIEFIFPNESMAAVRSQAVAALVKLGEAVRMMLDQFEGAIQKDTSKPPPGGGVHPLTRYVMNFLVFLSDYSGPVSDIVEDWPVKAPTPPPEYHFSSPTSGGVADTPAVEISTRLAWLFLVLLCKLDGKAAVYDDVALSYLFLANNLNYVVSKIGKSNLRLLIGQDWLWKHDLKVKKYLANYEKIGWDKVISSLPENPTAGIPPPEVRERFEKFNVSFQEAYKKQSSWIIPDPKIRDVVKASLANKIVSGYRVFYQKHRVRLGVMSIVRYAPEDLDNYLSDLFFAASGNDDTSSHKSSTTSYLSSRGR